LLTNLKETRGCKTNLTQDVDFFNCKKAFKGTKNYQFRLVKTYKEKFIMHGRLKLQKLKKNLEN
jgi:hypothetical protein